MDAHVQAGIDLYGSALRYAEVEQYGAGRHRLLRLGSCDFDFDVTRMLWGDGDASMVTQRVETLSEALADAYEDTAAQELRVVAHPPQTSAFFAPVPARTGASARQERFRREARLLMQAGPPPGPEGPAPDAPPSAVQPYLSADELYADDDGDVRRRWFHVLTVDGRAHERFTHVAKNLDVPSFRWTTSMAAAAQAASARGRGERAPDAERAPEANAGAEASFALVVGTYREHLEVALCCAGRLHHALHAPRATSSDSVYFAAALLERLGIRPADVRRIFTYGFEDAPEAFDGLDRLTSTPPERLDFRPALGLAPERLDTSAFEAGAYVPCIGAAL